MKTILIYSYALFLSFYAQLGLADNDQQAIIARLAVQSLMLDVVKVGDNYVAVSEKGHILIGENQGRLWRQVPVPTRGGLNAVYFLDDKLGWAVGRDALILHSKDGGESWSKSHEDITSDPLLDVWFENKNIGLAFGAYGAIYKTSNAGKTWQQTLLNEDEDFHLNQVSVVNNTELFIAAESGKFYHSKDAGLSWLSKQSPYSGSFYGSLKVSEKQTLVFGLRGNIYLVDVDNNQWQKVQSDSLALLMNGIKMQNGDIVLIGAAGTVLISKDNGLSFLNRQQADRKMISAVIETSDHDLILVGENGVRRLSYLSLVGRR